MVLFWEAEVRVCLLSTQLNLYSPAEHLRQQASRVSDSCRIRALHSLSASTGVRSFTKERRRSTLRCTAPRGMQTCNPYSSASSTIVLIAIGRRTICPDFRCLTLNLSITFSDLPSLVTS